MQNFFSVRTDALGYSTTMSFQPNNATKKSVYVFFLSKYHLYSKLYLKVKKYLE